MLHTAQPADSDGAEDAEAEPEEPVKIMEIQRTFDEFVVWGHEAIPAADDTFVKGVEEWLQFADAVCFIPIYYDLFGLFFCPGSFLIVLDAYNPNIREDWKGVCYCLRACWVRVESMGDFYRFQAVDQCIW